MARSLLCFDVDREVGLEFHSEVVGKEGDLLDETLGLLLIKVRDLGFLLGDEVLQLFQKGHTLGQNFIDSLDRDLLQ